MSLNRWAVCRDDNETEIVNALRKIGVQVWYHDQPLDLLVVYRDTFMFLECKDGNKPPSARKLTSAQQKFMDSTLGCPRAVVNSVDEAVAFVLNWKGREDVANG